MQPTRVAQTITIPRWARVAVVLAALSILVASDLRLNVTPASATHFRYGNITWRARTDISPTTVEFTLTSAFRRCGYAGSAADGCPAVGDVISEDIGFTELLPGDGSTIGSPLQFEVIAVNPIQDWLLAMAERTGAGEPDKVLLHTYATPTNGGAPWLATIDSCCRISPPNHINNPDGWYRVETLVDLSTGNDPPSTSLPPIVSCVLGTLCQFYALADDPDGDPLRWRMSSACEAASGCAFTQPGPPQAPNSLSVDTNTGLVSWDTTGATINTSAGFGLYSAQLTIEDLAGSTPKSKTAVDFFVRVAPAPPYPPEFVVPPSPVPGSTIAASVGSPISITLQASDIDVGDVVALGDTGLPAGMVCSYGSPANPANGSCSWTPGPGDAGSHIVVFTATDSFGVGAAPLPIEIDVTESSSCSVAASLIGCWKLDEGAGATASDSSVYGNDASLNNGPVWAGGFSGAALQFDGTNDFVHVPDAPILDIGLSDFTMMAWVYLDTAPTQHAAIMSKSISGCNPGYYFAILNDRRLLLELNQSSGCFVAGASTVMVPTLSWHHVAISVDRSGLATFYLDGTPGGTVDVSSHSGDIGNGEPLVIGAQLRPSVANVFPGRLDELKLYDRMLTGAEIQAEAAAQPPAITMSPVSDTNVNELGAPYSHSITATLVPAASGIPVTLTITGANAGAGYTCAPVSCQTDGAGEVTFTYSATNFGDDELTATAAGYEDGIARKTWSVSTLGNIFPVAGGSIGDGLPAPDAALAAPREVARNPVTGDLYVADHDHHRVRRIDAGADGVVDGDPDEIIDTVAGTGVAGYGGDGGPAVDAQLNSPSGVAVNSAGTFLYISDMANHIVRRVDLTTGTITRIAGLAGMAGHTAESGTATSMRLDTPRGLSVDGAGNVYVADHCNHRVRAISLAGGMATVAGSSATGCSGGDFAGDGGDPAAARLNAPTDVAIIGGGFVIADLCNQRVRQVDTLFDTITTVAGSSAVPPGAAACTAGGYSDGGGSATAALLNRPHSLIVSGSTVYFTEEGNHIVRQVTSGAISLTAGTPTTSGYLDGAAASALFNNPIGIAADGSGVLVGDTLNHRLRRIEAGNVSSVGGTGSPTFCGDNHAAIDTSCLNSPGGLVATATGDLYIMDIGNHRVRHIDVATSSIRTVAGNGSPSYCGDAGAPTSACLQGPSDGALGPGGLLYVADRYNHRVRAIQPGGDGVVNGGAGETIGTVAGNGTPGYAGDGGAAAAAQLNQPISLTVAADGTLYIADHMNCVVRAVAHGGDGVVDGGADETISTYAGTTCGFFGDGGAATSAQLAQPIGLAFDTSGALFIADTYNCRVRRVAGGTITTVAGSGSCGFAGDIGPATSASLDGPVTVRFGGLNELIIIDYLNHRLRTVFTGADGVIDGGPGENIITTAGGGNPTPGFCGDPPPITLAVDACLNSPSGLARDGLGNLYLSDTGNHRVRKIQSDCDLDGLIDSEETGIPTDPPTPPTTDTFPCIADSDGDGFDDPQAVSHASPNANRNEDNCPLASNPTQLNTDAAALANGSLAPGDDTTIVYSDHFGDACDDDADNDGIPDADELSGAMCGSISTDPFMIDTDGDHLTDKWECVKGSNPTDPGSKFLGSGFSDDDGDKINDVWESRGYIDLDVEGLSTDTDADGCADLVEMASIDGDKFVTTTDRLAVARRSLNIWAPEPDQDYVLDIDKDGNVGIGDRLFVARAQLLSDWQPKSCP